MNQLSLFKNPRLPLFAVLLVGFGCNQSFAGMMSSNIPSVNEIEKYLIVGFASQDAGNAAVNLQNGEFGADREVLSQGGTSPTGSSFPTINSVFDQRWVPKGDEAYLVHPISGNQIAPFEGIDYSGNIAITSDTGGISVSNTDIFADLGLYDANLNEIGIVAANSSDPVLSISNANFFSNGRGETDPLGKLPEENSQLPVSDSDAVGFLAGVDLSPLTDELEAWKTFLDNAGNEGTITKNIEERSYKDISKGGPFVIELRDSGTTAGSDYDLSFEDTNGDGLVIIDVDRGDSDWEINNSDVIIDGPENLKAIFRVKGESNMSMSNSSIQIGDGGISNDNFGAVFYKGDRPENDESGNEVFNGNNVVFKGLAFWELNQGTSDSDQKTINIQNGQGCAQFIGSIVLHTSTSRFNKCTFGAPEVEQPPVDGPLVPEPSSAIVWFALSLLPLARHRRKSPALS